MRNAILQYSILLLMFLPLSSAIKAQCGLGEVEITVVAYSYDVWAEESYWELVPAGNGCGNGTLISGGSEEVGCAGDAPTGENGIPDYGTEFTQVCVPEGQWLDLIFVDSYGDGGLAFDIFQEITTEVDSEIPGDFKRDHCLYLILIPLAVLCR